MLYPSTMSARLPGYHMELMNTCAPCKLQRQPLSPEHCGVPRQGARMSVAPFTLARNTMFLQDLQMHVIFTRPATSS